MVKKLKSKSKSYLDLELKNLEMEMDLELDLEKEITRLINIYKNIRHDQANWTAQEWVGSNLNQQNWIASDVFFLKCEQLLIEMTIHTEKRTTDRLKSLLNKIIIPKLKNLGLDFTHQAAFKSKKSKPNKHRKSQSNRKKLS